MVWRGEVLVGLLLALATCACTGTWKPWTDEPVSEINLWARAEATDDGRVELLVGSSGCDDYLWPIRYQNEDRLEATLGEETIVLKERWYEGPWGLYRGKFDRANVGNALRIDIVRPGGGGLRGALEVELPSPSVLLSPTVDDHISRSSDWIVLAWEAVPGADPERVGADLLIWSAESTSRCVIRGVTPNFSGEYPWTRDAPSIELSPGTLALPPLMGANPCKTKLALSRINTGQVHPELCWSSEIEVRRNTKTKFWATP